VRIQVGGEDRAILRVVDLARLVPGDQDADTTFGDSIDGERFQIDRGDAMRISDYQLPAVSGVGVLMEVERCRARFAGEPNHPMAGFMIDPLLQQLFLRAKQLHCGKRH
jgi:hypothetical protein